MGVSGNYSNNIVIRAPAAPVAPAAPAGQVPLAATGEPGAAAPQGQVGPLQLASLIVAKHAAGQNYDAEAQQLALAMGGANDPAMQQVFSDREQVYKFAASLPEMVAAQSQPAAPAAPAAPPTQPTQPTVTSSAADAFMTNPNLSVFGNFDPVADTAMFAQTPAVSAQDMTRGNYKG